MVYRHIENVVVNTVFSECGNFRYQLIIKKNGEKESKTICVIMQNPSVANSEIADRSVHFLEKLIFIKNYPEFNGVNKIIIVNQFAYIQTNGFNGAEREIGDENDKYINKSIDESDIILIAWGSSNRYEKRKETINKLLFSTIGKVVYQTKSHPSRGTYANFIEPYKTVTITTGYTYVRN